jgi:predicted RNase H-like nuclease (RuvC/YqgF family)
MKERIAVATISGKAYYLLVRELKRRNMPFLSLTPMEVIPVQIKVVLTTKEEKRLINHEKILAYQDDVDPEILISEALRLAHGKEYYEKVVIGVDPGEAIGWAVLADGKVTETGSSFSVEETLGRIENILKNFGKNAITMISVKVGDGVPAYREKFLHALDNILPSNVTLESVNESGTNRYLSDNKHRRGLRDIASAIRIAGRNGHKFPRRKANESSS